MLDNEAIPAEERELEVRFGALAPRLQDQLKDYPVSAEDIDGYQKDADAITRLGFHNYLTNSEVKKARRKLGRDILFSVREALQKARKESGA